MKSYLIETMPDIDIRLTHSRKKFAKWLREFDYICDKPKGIAETATIDFGDGERFAIVWMSKSLKYSAAQDAATLAHEAVHVADWYFRYLGEDNPASEERAYVVENIAEYLIEKHFKWKCRKLNARK